MTESKSTTGGADISECGHYRYRLWRELKEPFDGTTCCFVMLNSSTAGADYNDATVRRCIYFAEREGHGLLMIVNFYAYRTSQPKELWRYRDLGGDIIGPDNDAFLSAEICSSELVIVAWGAQEGPKSRSEKVEGIAARAGKELYCLGKTKAGHPKHPLYLRKDTPLEPWARPPS